MVDQYQQPAIWHPNLFSSYQPSYQPTQIQNPTIQTTNTTSTNIQTFSIGDVNNIDTSQNKDINIPQFVKQLSLHLFKDIYENINPTHLKTICKYPLLTM
jgi:hypothetical protein